MKFCCCCLFVFYCCCCCLVSKFVMEHSLKECREQLTCSNRTLDLADKVREDGAGTLSLTLNFVDPPALTLLNMLCISKFENGTYSVCMWSCFLLNWWLPSVILLQNLSRLFFHEHLVLYEKIDLSHNQLLTLDPNIRCLVSVSELILDDNQVEQLPSEMASLRRLTTLSLKNNSIQNASVCVCKTG